MTRDVLGSCQDPAVSSPCCVPFPLSLVPTPPEPFERFTLVGLSWLFCLLASLRS